jgi:hypothetical protein
LLVLVAGLIAPRWWSTSTALADYAPEIVVILPVVAFISAIETVARIERRFWKAPTTEPLARARERGRGRGFPQGSSRE